MGCARVWGRCERVCGVYEPRVYVCVCVWRRCGGGVHACVCVCEGPCVCVCVCDVHAVLCVVCGGCARVCGCV